LTRHHTHGNQHYKHCWPQRSYYELFHTVVILLDIGCNPYVYKTGVICLTTIDVKRNLFYTRYPRRSRPTFVC